MGIPMVFNSAIIRYHFLNLGWTLVLQFYLQRQIYKGRGQIFKNEKALLPK